MKKFAMIIAALAMMLGLGACSIVSTEPDMVALHYSGGPMSSKSFKDCIPASTRQTNGGGDTYYMYPTSLRTYDASNDGGAEAKPITVVSKDNAEMSIPVSVTLTLDTKCEVLRKFHENIGNRYKGFWGGSDFEDGNKDGIPDGWVQILNFYIGKDLDTMLDRVAQGYNWRELWNDPATKSKMEVEVEKNLSSAIDDRMGGTSSTSARSGSRSPTRSTLS